MNEMIISSECKAIKQKYQGSFVTRFTLQTHSAMGEFFDLS